MNKKILKITIFVIMNVVLCQNANAQVFQRVLSGFRGNNTIHTWMGGLHTEVGPCFVQYEPFDEDLEIRFISRLGYSYYKYFPISIDADFISMGSYRSIGLGLGSAYFFSNRLALNYGLGWQKNLFIVDGITLSNSKNYYYSVGFTYMFPRDDWEEDLIGGIKYTYCHSFGNNDIAVNGHYLTYIFGKEGNRYGIFLIPIVYGLLLAITPKV